MRTQTPEPGSPLRNAANGRAALDIDGVLDIGVKAWQTGYRWPVSDAEFDALAAETWTGWLQLAAGLGDVDRDVFLADCRLPGFLLQHAHLCAARDRIAATGCEAVSGAVAAPYLSPDWAALGAPAALGCGAMGLASRGVRAAAKGFLLGRSAPLGQRLAASAGFSSSWALGSRTPLRAAYLERKGVACRYLTVADFAGGTAGAALTDNLGDAAGLFIERVTDAVRRRLGVEVDRLAIAGVLKRRLEILHALAQAVGARRGLPKTLLLTDLGLPSHRAIARTLRRRGVEVIGFHHGNDMGMMPNPPADIVDLTAVDRFVVPGPTCARWRRAEYRSNAVADFHDVEFEPVDTTAYDTWLAQGRKAAMPRKVEKVMIVGFPPTWIRYAHFAAHWSLSQIDVEIRLLRSLADAGFSVLYKAHPEWETRLRRLFANQHCHFVDGHLEECWTEADALVFPRTSSTSFGFALCTNRPIVVLDNASQRWNPEAYEMLARRCRMIPAATDENLRVTFDQDSLIAALKEPVCEPDQSFVLEAMCNRQCA